LLLADSTVGKPKEEQVSAESLFLRAGQQELCAEGTAPFTMRAAVQVFSSTKASPLVGEYRLDWVSPTCWRESVRFGPYERLRVRDDKGYWQKTGLPYQPTFVFHLDTMLHLRDTLKIGEKQTLGKVRSREKDGARQQCTDARWPGGLYRTMCFDESNGALISIDYPTGEHQHPPEVSRIEYGAFKNNSSGKSVPWEIRALRERNVVVSVKVLEIVKLNEENTALFSAPANAEFFTQCDDPQQAEILDRVAPHYPERARRVDEQGRVMLYATIETDGKLSRVAVIQRVSTDLGAAAVEAVSRWRYKPAACGQIPIRAETLIEIDFSLQR
jgi:TonB family protein